VQLRILRARELLKTQAGEMSPTPFEQVTLSMFLLHILCSSYYAHCRH
jgi:hypothetical protein